MLLTDSFNRELSNYHVCSAVPDTAQIPKLLNCHEGEPKRYTSIWAKLHELKLKKQSNAFGKSQWNEGTNARRFVQRVFCI